jgi:peptidoglycan DL-endopeptidase CwlO
LTAGAIALAVVAPALEPVEQATAAAQAAPANPVSAGTASSESSYLDPESAFSARAMVAQRASRAAFRRATAVTRPAMTPAFRRPIGSGLRPVLRPALRTARAGGSAASSSDAEDRAARRTTSGENRRNARSVRIRQARHSRPARAVTTRHAGTTRHEQVVHLGDMTAVIAYAKSQVGRRYIRGGEGSGGFDCSGLTKRAYAKAGIRLPHSSRAQAARARRISRSQARPGDLVVGDGHVGIYMGKGMMIDAGNQRVGVVYRKLYSGLQVERL